MGINVKFTFTGLKRWSDEFPSSGSDSTFWIFMMGMIVCVQILDLVTTRLVIDHGGTELNPMFSPLLDSIWFWPTMAFAKVVFLFWLYIALTTSDRYYPKAAWITGGIILLQGAVVVGNNTLVLSGLW